MEERANNNPDISEEEKKGGLAWVAKQAYCKATVIRQCSSKANKVTNGIEEPRNICMHLSKFAFGQRQYDRECGKGKLEKFFIHRKKMKLNSYSHYAKKSTPDG